MNTAIKYLRLVFNTSALSLLISSAYAEQLPKNNSAKTPVTYVIETQVQGSQEQPKVIYITPWQELNSTLSIDEHELTIRLPAFAPVNPKVFREQVSHYYQQKTAVTKNNE